MNKIAKNSFVFLSVLVVVVAAVLVAVPTGASAQVYYNNMNGGYSPQYGGYGMHYGNYMQHSYARHPVYNNYYDQSYMPMPYYQNNYYQTPVSVSCSFSSGSDNIGPYIAWSAYAYGGSGNFSYGWSGNDTSTSLNTSTINVHYLSSGTKSMNVTVYSNDGQVATAYCGSTYFNYYPNYYQYPYQYQNTYTPYQTMPYQTYQYNY